MPLKVSLGASWGASRMRLGGLLGAFSGPPGPPGGLLGASWGPLGASGASGVSGVLQGACRRPRCQLRNLRHS
eukprot:72739-Pyramimonas_sp.AAC.1